MMLMLDIGTKIANVLTIIILISYASYLYTIAKETAKYHMVAFYTSIPYLVFKPLIDFISSFKRKTYESSGTAPIISMWKNDKVNFFIYLIIPTLFGVGLVLISQFYDGIYKIRYDFQILLGAVLWFFMLSKDKFQHDLINSLYDIIKDLKDRLSKYE